jgi:hypothetical protein
MFTDERCTAPYFGQAILLAGQEKKSWVMEVGLQLSVVNTYPEVSGGELLIFNNL